MFFFFKQKTAYEMRISDWSSDVCSSDLQTSKAGPVRRAGLFSVLRVGPRHRGGTGELVDPLVFHMAVMAAHPLPVNTMGGYGGLDALPQVDILYLLAVGGLPPPSLPPHQPFAGDSQGSVHGKRVALRVE